MPELSPLRIARLIAALGLSSSLSVALSLTRVLRSGSRAYAFLNWNLFLAWVPLVLALVFATLARRSPRPRLAMGCVLAVWLVFFPNAPYLVTDLVHLVHQAPRGTMPVVYDSVMFFSFAFSGIVTGFLSLRVVEEHVREWWGRAASWAVVLVTLSLGAFGIYLGRFERYNSWDVVTHPFVVGSRILQHVGRAPNDPGVVLVTGLLAVFLVVVYVTTTQLALALRADHGDRRVPPIRDADDPAA